MEKENAAQGVNAYAEILPRYRASLSLDQAGVSGKPSNTSNISCKPLFRMASGGVCMTAMMTAVNAV